MPSGYAVNKAGRSVFAGLAEGLARGRIVEATLRTPTTMVAMPMTSVRVGMSTEAPLTTSAAGLTFLHSPHAPCGWLLIAWPWCRCCYPALPPMLPLPPPLLPRRRGLMRSKPAGSASTIASRWAPPSSLVIQLAAFSWVLFYT